jgi:hypothetical protein
MPILGPFTNAYVSINGVDLSDHARSVTITDNKDEVDVSAFSSGGYKATTKGLGDAQIDVELLQDLSAGKTHATLQPLVASTTGVAIEVRAVNSARSATNPAFLLNSGLLFTYNGLDGNIGDAAVVKATFKNAPGGTGITYPTS